MSFLADEDARETLQVALAFIDACDECDEATGSSPLNNLHSSSSSDSHASCVQNTAIHDGSEGDGSGVFSTAPAQPRARTSKSHAEAVKRNRAKKKAEATLLRDEVANLEAKLSQLQQTAASSSSLQVYLQRTRRSWSSIEAHLWSARDTRFLAAKTPPAAKSAWREVATAQAWERRKSQSLNAELRKAVAKQVKLVESLEAMVARKSNQFGLHLLRDEQQQFLRSNAPLIRDAGVLSDLRSRAQHLQTELDLTFSHRSWAEIADSVVCTSELRLDAVAGPVSELRMNAPLRGSAQEAGEVLWQLMIATDAVIQAPQYYMKREKISSSSLQKNFIMLLDASAGAIELQGVTYVQRFSSATRDAYVWSSAILSTHNNEVFREKGCVVATSGDWSSLSPTKALLRGFYQVSCDARRDEARPLALHQREFVLKTLSNRIRNFQQFMQSTVLDEFAGVDGNRRRLSLLLKDAATCQNW